MRRPILALIALFLAVGSTNAQTTWKTDKAHSQINFTVSHMVFSEVAGTFKDFNATLVTGKDDFTDATFEATIKSGSIDTQNENRDKHVKSDDFLNAEKYPEIKFKSTKVEKTGNDTYKITGDFTMRDVTKSIVLDAIYKGTIVDSRGTVKSAFKATTTIDRLAFGVAWNKTIESGGLVAGKDIEVTLLIEFNKQK